MKVTAWLCLGNWWLSASHATHTQGLGPFHLFSSAVPHCCITLDSPPLLSACEVNKHGLCIYAKAKWQQGPSLLGPAPCSTDTVLLSGQPLIRAEQGSPHGGSWTMSNSTRSCSPDLLQQWACRPQVWVLPVPLRSAQRWDMIPPRLLERCRHLPHLTQEQMGTERDSQHWELQEGNAFPSPLSSSSPCFS